MGQAKKRNIIIGVLCGILLLMVAGYAAFNTVLNINGLTKISSNWDIRITNITTKQIVGGASNAENPTYTDLTATFKANLVSPGDSIEYDVTISNQGTVNAKLDKINVTPSNNSAIKFTTSGLVVGDKLNAGTSSVLTVKVEYDKNVTLQPESTIGTLSVTLDYVQDDGNTVVDPTPVPSEEAIYRFGMDSVSVGDSVDSINGITTDYTTLGQDVFIKHTVADSKVSGTEACMIKDGILQCLKPGDYTSTNETLLNIFGNDACEVGDFGTRCKAEVVSVLAIPDGDIYVYSGTADCDIYADGSSECFG